MAIRAIVFDIGGVLEITPRLAVEEKWEEKLKLRSGELNERLGSVWEGGATGKITLQEVHNQIGQIMGMDASQVTAFMDDVWTEYLGILNVELANYFRNLRPKYQTAIISNSFIGAREIEAEHYQFDTICDFILY